MAKQKRPNPKTKHDKVTEKTKRNTWHTWIDIFKAVSLLFLSTVYSRISLLALAPVYGSTPAGIYHNALCTLAILAGYSVEALVPGNLDHAESFLPAFTLSIPIVQGFLFQQSSLFGNPAGPVLTELMTIFPLLLLSMSTFYRLINGMNFNRTTSIIAKLTSLVAGVSLFKLADTAARSFIPLYIGSSSISTTFTLQVTIASINAILFSSYKSWLLFSLPAAYIILATNINMPFVHTLAHVNSKLHEINVNLVDRQESLTGYISVLDNTQYGLRVMRCDHSLLGGEWLQKSVYNLKVAEPIYAVFTMLEAVRLVEPRREDRNSNALVIGLGIGTTPAALIQHGIETTVVEIDPVVYKFALQHFHFPQNHTAIIDDAVTFVETAQKESKKYDYIIHDVFTGGVEPVDLFTLEFIQGLNGLLKDDGVIAINYAGDITLPGAGLIIRTIKRVFPECRIFRENIASESPAAENPIDFINMIIFCKKNGASPLTFRPATEDDYLGSQLRRSFMWPQDEIDPSIFAVASGSTDQQQILEVGKTSVLEPYHIQNAIGHWNIMRDVLPAKVWETF